MNALRAVLMAATFILVGCHSSHPSAEANTAPHPAAPPTIADTEGVIPRFTQDIWPVVESYNAHPGQGNPGGINPAYEQFTKITDKGLDAEGWNRLSAAVHHLGTVQEMDETHGDIGRDASGLHLADTRLVVETPDNAKLDICYTYTAESYQGQRPVHTPGASEATVELHKTDNNWYLRSITNDHVVPNCPTANTGQ
jgi:hypothetical protein